MTSWRRREPLERLPEDAIEEVFGKIDEPPENMLSRPTIDGDTVENVVPLAALDEMTEGFLLLSYW